MSGVHAAGQVVHFDCSGPIPARKWAPALNGRLPSTIRVRESVARPWIGMPVTPPPTGGTGTRFTTGAAPICF